MKPNTTRPPDAFQTFLEAIARPAAFPQDDGVAANAIINVIQTHASAVLLTETRVYKLKKPVNLDFLDYSTAERRRRFCIEECAINSALAPGVYLGVAPILSQHDGTLHFGAIFPIDQTPAIGDRIEEGAVVDFAVVMRRLPESRTLASLVDAGVANADLLRIVARSTATFHIASANGLPIAPYGTVETVLANIMQTVEQSEADIGSTLSAEAHEAIRRYITDFIDRRRELLESRLRAGWVRDCHGDLRLEHVYAMPRKRENGQEDIELLMIDRIEFDPRFRYGDVAGEIAFLVVELERAGRPDLARAFTREYIQQTGSSSLLEALPLYLVYRAMVRGKVRSILLKQPGIDEKTRASARVDAEAMYGIAAHHASTTTEPVIALIGGLMGVGKSTLAHALHTELGWPVLSSDIIRKRLAGMPLTTPVSATDQEEIYTADWNRRVYDRLLEEGSARLAEGHSILLDATFTRRDRRQMITNLARESGAHAVFLECVCPRDVAMRRLAARWQAKIQAYGAGDQRDAIFASDGRPEIYDRQSQRWESYDAKIEPDMDHAVIDTTWISARQTEHALAALNIPRLACWLD